VNHQYSSYHPADRQAILRVAAMSALFAVEHDRALPLDVNIFSPRLREIKAAFVTLNRNGKLRGCIGSLTATKPLIHEVAHFAHAAAVKDPRFPRVTPQELPALDIHISVLTTPDQMNFSSMLDLIDQIRPNVDGLILEEGPHRGTFLPGVWSQIPEKPRFLEALKAKAGLPQGYWSPTLKVYRYQADIIE